MSLSLAALGTIVSLASNIYGNNQSQKATEEQNSLLNKRTDDLDAWYNAEYNKSYLDTEESKSVISNLQSQMKKSLESQNNSAVKTGATAESKVATQTGLQDSYARALNNLAGGNTQRKDNVRRSYDMRMNDLLNQKSNMIGSEQNSWNNFSQNIATALGSFNQGYGEGAYDDLFK